MEAQSRLPLPQEPRSASPDIEFSAVMGDFYRYVDFSQLMAESTFDPETRRRTIPENGFPLTTGKRGQIRTISGEPTPRQGNALVIIVGDEEDYRNPPTSGEDLWRPHSGCRFAEGGISWSKAFTRAIEDVRAQITSENWERLRQLQRQADPPGETSSYQDFENRYLRDLTRWQLTIEPDPSCDCRDQRIEAVKTVVENGGGVFDLAKQEARGLGLLAKYDIYALQALGLNTDEARRALGLEWDVRDYSHCTRALLAWTVEFQEAGFDRDLTDITLMTNNPLKTEQFSRGLGKQVKSRKHVHGIGPNNRDYAATKALMGHDFSQEDLRLPD